MLLANPWVLIGLSGLLTYLGKLTQDRTVYPLILAVLIALLLKLALITYKGLADYHAQMEAEQMEAKRRQDAKRLRAEVARRRHEQWQAERELIESKKAGLVARSQQSGDPLID